MGWFNCVIYSLDGLRRQKLIAEADRETGAKWRLYLGRCKKQQSFEGAKMKPQPGDGERSVMRSVSIEKTFTKT